MLDVGCQSKPDPNPPASNIQHPTSDFSDRSSDGTPGFLRLDEEADRRAFRHWLTFLAESQYHRQPGRLPREINDCAALIRFAYRQALREHDGAWASDLDLDAAPGEGSVQKFTYPHTPLGAGLFRVRPGPFVASNSTDGAFTQFADAHTLQQFNTYLVTRDIRRAQPGDLLFECGSFALQFALATGRFLPAGQRFGVFAGGLRHTRRAG